MSLTSLGFNAEGIEIFGRLLLSRKEEASYAGVTESGIRDAEARGLRHATDREGRAWLAPEDLDAWMWRKPIPSASKRASVLKVAARQRLREMRQRELEAEKLAAAEAEADEAEQRALIARWELEDRLRRDANERNRATASAFKQRHMDHYEVRDALGLSSLDASREIRRLCKLGLLREVAPPMEIVVVDEPNEPPTLGLGWSGVVRGGPYYSREEVLLVQREIATFAAGPRQP